MGHVFTKTCIKCNITKELDYFEFRLDTKNYRNQCRMCNKGYNSSRKDKQKIIKDLYLEGKKHCGKCKEIKNLEEFNNDKYTVTGKSSLCKLCISNKYTKDELKNFACKSKYGITLKEYKELSILQEGKCDICKKPNLNLVVDHCHNTGKVRGLLCTQCNSGLGFFRDNINNLNEAINYLNK